MMSPPRLYHFRISHYNEKVRWALDFKKWPHHRRALLPGFHIPFVRFLTGQNKVPAIKLDGKVLYDSSKIISEIERLRPEPQLYPSDPVDRKRALAIEEFFDEEVAPAFRRLFWSTYFDDVEKCTEMAADGFGPFTHFAWRAAFPLMRPLFCKNMGVYEEQIEWAKNNLGTYFDRLEREIGSSGYMVGNTFSIADLTAAAVMTAIIRPPEFSYPLPEPWPEGLIALRESVSKRAGFKWVQDIYSRHRGESCELHR